MRYAILISLLLCSLSAFAHIQCGNTTIEPSADSNSNQPTEVASCTPASNSTVFDAQLLIDSSGSTTMEIGVYDSDGGSAFAQCAPNCPGTLICQNSVTVTLSAGQNWQPIDLSSAGCGTLTGGHLYWLVYNTSASNKFFAATGGVACFSFPRSVSSPLASSFFSNGGSNSCNTATESLYLDIDTAAKKSLRGYVIAGLGMLSGFLMSIFRLGF